MSLLKLINKFKAPQQSGEIGLTGANPSGDTPKIDKRAYVDPTARIIGNVHIGRGCYVGPYAVIRADEASEDGKVAPIIIGEETNLQDGVIVHSLAGSEVKIGRRCSVAHGAVIHGPCTIGDGSFIGFRSVVFKSTLEESVFVSTGAVVEGVRLERGESVGSGISVLTQQDVFTMAGKTSDEQKAFMEKVVNVNVKLAEGYSRA